MSIYPKNGSCHFAVEVTILEADEKPEKQGSASKIGKTLDRNNLDAKNNHDSL